MKKIIYILLFLLPRIVFSQGDQVMEILDSLTKVYYYNKLEEEETPNKYGFKKGFIPICDDRQYSERFEQLNKTTPFKLEFNPIVKKYISNYLNAPKSVGAILANSKYYFPFFEDYLLKYQMPLELKYLSVIESALNPTAKSWCGAAGLWQFMPATGKAYGLNITSYQDERYHLDLETDAACRYLKDLYSIYGDWALAIAGYNCGAGNVNKAIKRAGGKKNFFDIMPYLPKETQGYVPAFMAATYVLNFAEEHNLPKVKSKILYSDIDHVEIKKQISIEKLASILGINPKELRYLNPSYYLGIIPGNNDLIKLPKQYSMVFIDKESYINGGLANSNFKAPSKSNEKKPIAVSSVPNPPVKKDPFGTVKSNGSPKTDIQPQRIREVVLCEVLSSFNVKTSNEIKVRNLKAIGESVPKNSILLGKVLESNGKKVFHFHTILNSNFSIDLSSDYLSKLEEGETIYLSSK